MGTSQSRLSDRTSLAELASNMTSARLCLSVSMQDLASTTGRSKSTIGRRFRLDGHPLRTLRVLESDPRASECAGRRMPPDRTAFQSRWTSTFNCPNNPDHKLVYGGHSCNDSFSLRFLRTCSATFVHKVDMVSVLEAIMRCSKQMDKRKLNRHKLGPMAIRVQLATLSALVHNFNVNACGHRSYRK